VGLYTNSYHLFVKDFEINLKILVKTLIIGFYLFSLNI